MVLNLEQGDSPSLIALDDFSDGIFLLEGILIYT
jgi:hypothetical protein